MPNPQLNIRVSEKTIERVNALAGRYGSQGRVIEVAVAKLYEEEIMSARVIRVQRNDDGSVQIFALSEPDLAGNRHWFIVGRLAPGDMVRTAAGWKRAAEATDEEILEAIK